HAQERLGPGYHWQNKLFLQNFQPSFTASELEILKQSIVAINYRSKGRISAVKQYSLKFNNRWEKSDRLFKPTPLCQGDVIRRGHRKLTRNTPLY
ncbi:MAG TPA: hypothetical protein V6D30_16290, partial [Leptolyngbyaceae cyanobacterium]